MQLVHFHCPALPWPRNQGPPVHGRQWNPHGQRSHGPRQHVTPRWGWAIPGGVGVGALPTDGGPGEAGAREAVRSGNRSVRLAGHRPATFLAFRRAFASPRKVSCLYGTPTWQVRLNVTESRLIASFLNSGP